MLCSYFKKRVRGDRVQGVTHRIVSPGVVCDIYPYGTLRDKDYFF